MSKPPKLKTLTPSPMAASPCPPLFFLSPRHHRITRQFRLLRRRKSSPIRSQSHTSDADSLAQFLSQIPNSLNSLSLSALTFASNLTPNTSKDWIFFTSPTPFNRFVLLRCPSVSFHHDDNLNEKLLKDERHYVRIHTGTTPTQFHTKRSESEISELQYSRVCVPTDDGGVIALDWPSNLDLNQEHGLDSTILLFPGTADGSSEQTVKDFVRQCLNRGLFPVVMNPRGCADSPLTTPRMFTAADSDDVSSAIQFLSRARPWSTFMAVGWGFGANMLTKYLAEVGEKTPLTAATCIDNPFDLEEVTRTSYSGAKVNRKLIAGLLKILKSNKGMFQGKGKGFDVESALSAKSVRDFDSAVSMISHGFETLDEFYSESSSRLMVGHIKVPILFIQSDDAAVPLFSIPRDDIAENLFTSLLLFSSLPSNIASDKSVIMWSQELTIEWLMAVELALLKGRHPLLMDLDVTINPSKRLAITESSISDSDKEHDTVLDLTESNGSNGYLLKPVKDSLQHDFDSEAQSAEKDTYELQDGDDREVNGVLPQSGPVNAELTKPESTDAVEVEGDKGQVLQTARVVMNVLDVTRPGALTEEAKKKVLTGVGQGETLLKVLQDSVPEDVRGKLTTSVSAILQAQGKNLSFDALIGQISKAKPKVNVNGNLLEKPGHGNEDTSSHLSETVSSPHDPSDSSSKTEASADKNHGESDDNVQSQEKSVKAVDLDESQSTNSVSSDDLQNKHEGNEPTMEDLAPVPHSDGNGHAVSTTTTDQPEKPQDLLTDKIIELGAKENSEAGEVKPLDSSEDKKRELEVKESSEPGEVKPLDSSKDKNGESDDKQYSETEEVKPLDSSKDKKRELEVKESSEPGEVKPLDSSKDKNGESDDKQYSETEEVKPLDSSKDKNRELEAKEGSEAGEVKPLDSSKDKNSVSDAKENSEAGEVKPLDSSKDKKKADIPSNVGEGDSQSHQTSSDSQPLEKQDNETKTSVPPPNLNQNKPSPDTKASAFNVSQALDAISGLDDSTQVAVNSVFNVIEEVINHLEENKEDDVSEKEGNESKGNRSVEKAKDGRSHEEVRSSLDTLTVDTSEARSDISDEGLDQQSDKLVGRKLVSKEKINDLYLMRANKTYVESVYNGYLQKFIKSNVEGDDKPLDLDTTADLLLDYNPEEDQYKVLEQPESDTDAAGHEKDESMETSYVILDSEKLAQPVNDLKKVNRLNGDVLQRRSSSSLDDLTQLVKNIVLDTLHVEVSRKLIGIDVEEMETSLARDMEEVANAVALAVSDDAVHNWCLSTDTNCVLQQGSGFDGAHIIETISSAVQNTNHLRKMMPVGVIVGPSLASLRKFFSVASVYHDFQNDEGLNLAEDEIEGVKPKTQLVAKEVDEILEFEEDEGRLSEKPIQNIDTAIEKVEKKEEKMGGDHDGVVSRETVMVGAVTAALGASAFLQQNKDEEGARDENLQDMSNPNKSHAVKLEESVNDKHQNMVISLAEKAMSVAAPVMPTKQDGEVDQDRLVAMLAELGQKGGMLKLVGKLALLWGGIRGAMSLINKLIGFLRIAERPLPQRLLAFGFMVLILWSPVAVPFLPTIVQNWATKSPSRIAEFVCTFGLYIAIAFLIVLWGKRIRGYEKPMQQYGLDLTSSENVQDLVIGLIGGIVLVMSIHSVNALLGFVDLSWSLSLISSPVDSTMKFKSWVNLVFLVGQGLVTAVIIASVEELFFRSWLAEEIAVDLGDHRGIILSGLAFSLCQSSLQAIPGLWLLSLCLAGERRRKQGSLFSPIGLHAGIMASCFVLQKGGFLIYRSHLPLWMTGTHPFQPFSGVVGLVFALLLALVLYPRQTSHDKEMQMTVQE